MSEIDERVARALGVDPDCWMVKAAIEAMREPTDGMIETGRRLQGIADEELTSSDMKAKWQAMIDEALK
jgi:hypothetical protein